MFLATYAAVAPRLSNGLAAVVNVTKQRKHTKKLVITASLFTISSTNARIQSGAISIVIPSNVFIKLTKKSIL